MASMRGLDQPDPLIGQQSGARRWQHPDKGIVERMQNQRRHGNLRRNPGTGCAMVIVIRAGKAGVAGGDLIVKLAQGRNSLQAIGRIDLRETAPPFVESAGADRSETSIRRPGWRALCSASAETPRSIAGETPTTAFR